MPIIAVALASYVAGLYAGFAGSVGLALLAPLAALALGARRGPAVGGALGALSLAGAAVAYAARSADARCLGATILRQSLVLVVGDSVAPGGYTRARIAECEGDQGAWLSVERGTAPPGSTVAARGAVLRTQRGILVQHASVVELRAPPWTARLRALAGAAVDRTFHGDAPLVRALLLADRHELAPDVRERFAAAGLAHILAIAGLHIGIIALAIGLGLELVGVSRPHAALITVGVLAVYVALIGAPAPAVRSATMLTALVLSRIAQRSTSRWAIVALGAAQPVIAPRVVLEVGYQLSVVGVTAMIASSRLGRRLGVNRRSVVARTVMTTMLGSAVATIGTAPIVAWVFGRVSIVAPLSNVAAVPLIALAQPAILCGLVLAPIHPLASLFADAAHPLLMALDRVAVWAASLPYASIAVAPTVAGETIAAVLSGSVIIACASEHWERPAVVAVIAAIGLQWLPFPLTSLRERLTELHMIDVGQGDAIALRTLRGNWLLFDAGRTWRTGDAGRATIIPYLGREGGGRLEMFVLSHPHSDHVGGAASVLYALHPRRYFDGGFPGPAEAYRASLDAARTEHVQWARVHPGDSLGIDEVMVRFLAPDSTWTASLVDPNLASVVALVRIGEVRILLMGDAERPEEDWLLAHVAGELHADILKVGHHGSSTSSSEAFLDAVAPRLALVSVGAGNSYGLPTPAIMRRLAAHGAQVLRTDRLGTIVAATDGHRVFINAAGDEWELPPRFGPSAVP
jgi:competence protein ComEC